MILTLRLVRSPLGDLIRPEDFIEETKDSDDAKIRLLVCNICQTVTPLPYFDGPNEYDQTGQARAQDHKFGDGRFHPFIVGTVSEKSWDNPRIRPEILAKLSEELTPGEGEGFGQEFYDVKNTFSEDAMKCWRIDHNRTTDCQDYKTEPKRLIPNTQADRRAEGLPSRARDIPTNMFLCDFCPYKSVVQTKWVEKNDKRFK